MLHGPPKTSALVLSMLFAILPQIGAFADSDNKRLTCFVVRPTAVFRETADEREPESNSTSEVKLVAPEYIKAKRNNSEAERGQVEQVEPSIEQKEKSEGNDRNQTRPKIALVLGGGGTRGAAHVGVLKVLEREGIKVDLIVGTSMGAIVGGLYSAGVPLSTLERRFDDGSMMGAFMTVPLYVRLALAPVLIAARLVHSPYDGLYHGNKFRNYLTKLMPDGKEQIEALKPPFRPVALNVVDGKAHVLSTGQLAYALQASSAVPALRKPVEIDDILYVDGGVTANLPVKQAKEMGADFVIAVNVNERVNDVPLKSFRKVGSISKRMVLLQLANNDDAQAALADVVIHPNVDGISLISTKPADAIKAVNEGESAAELAIPEIKAKIAKAQGRSFQANE
jgi:NTE family protein